MGGRLMHVAATVFRRNLLSLMLAAVLAFSMHAPASAAFYIDRTLGDVPADKRTPVKDPQPVQLLFSFATDDAPNAKAATYLKAYVFAQVEASGRFKAVTETPSENGAILNIAVNNITEKGAAGKGFKVGLTFGLAGTVVADSYDMKFDFAPAAGNPIVTKHIAHRLYTKLGAKSPPENADKAKNVDDAIKTIIRQGIDHGLNDLAADPGFAIAAQATPAPATGQP